MNSLQKVRNIILRWTLTWNSNLDRYQTIGILEERVYQIDLLIVSVYTSRWKTNEAYAISFQEVRSSLPVRQSSSGCPNGQPIWFVIHEFAKSYLQQCLDW